MGHWLHYLYLECLTNLIGNTWQLQCACIPHLDHLYIYIQLEGHCPDLTLCTQQ